VEKLSGQDDIYNFETNLLGYTASRHSESLRADDPDNENRKWGAHVF
jgi:hypothetical protein